MVATLVVDDVVPTYFVELSSVDLDVRAALEKSHGGDKEVFGKSSTDCGLNEQCISAVGIDSLEAVGNVSRSPFLFGVSITGP